MDVSCEPVPEGFGRFVVGADDAAVWASACTQGLGLVLVNGGVAKMATDDVVRAANEGAAVVACTRPVTDTIKEVADGFVVGTVDRDRLLAACLPVAIPAHLVGAATPDPGRLGGELADRLGDWLAGLARTVPVRYLGLGG